MPPPELLLSTLPSKAATFVAPTDAPAAVAKDIAVANNTAAGGLAAAAGVVVAAADTAADAANSARSPPAAASGVAFDSSGEAAGDEGGAFPPAYSHPTGDPLQLGS